MLHARRRRGFTLIELLIVIIIMGILAGSMMLTMGKARAKAEAIRIVSDMKMLKKASELYFCDHGKWFQLADDNSEGYGMVTIEELNGYVDQQLTDSTSFVSGEYDKNGNWDKASSNKYFIYICEPADDTTYESDIDKYNVFIAANVTDYVDYDTRKALEKIAANVGLYKATYSEHLDEDPSNWYFVAVEGEDLSVAGDGGMLMRVN